MYSQYRKQLNASYEETKFIAGIWPRKHIGVIASSPGAGKTWYMLKLALDLSNGGTIFNGMAYNEPPTKSLILCGETGYEILAERTKALHQDYNPDKIAVYSAIDMLKSGRTLILDDPTGWSNIQGIIREETPDIVFFDTLISFRSDDENAAKDTSRILGKLRALADKENCAIILMHHVRKRKIRDQNVQGGQDEIIGSSAMMRYASIAFLLDKSNDVNILRCVKTWWKQPDPFKFRLKGNDKHITIEPPNEWDDITEAKARARKYIQNMKGAFLTVEDVMKAIGISHSTAREALRKEATSLGKIGDRNTEQFYVE